MALQGGWPLTTVGIITCSIPHQRLLTHLAKILSLDFFQLPMCYSSPRDVKCSEKCSDLFCSVVFILLDNQQEHLCVLGSYVHRWTANRECSVVLQVVRRGCEWLPLWENVSERPEICCVWLGKLSLCWSLQHGKYLRCTFLWFLLLWKAKLS